MKNCEKQFYNLANLKLSLCNECLLTLSYYLARIACVTSSILNEAGSVKQRPKTLYFYAFHRFLVEKNKVFLFLS